MGGISRRQKEARDQSLVRGIKKRLADERLLAIRGRQVAPGDVIAILEQHIELLRRVASVRAQLSDAVRAERAAEKEILSMLDPLYRAVVNRYGERARPLADFGLKLHGKPGPKTNESKLESARKSKLTREARATRPGPRAKRRRRR
jgi:hypothetical protein